MPMFGHPHFCAKSPVNLQASCQLIFSVSYPFSKYFTTPHGGEGPYSRWGRRPQPETLKSGNAAAGHSPSFAMGRTPVPPTPLHRTSVAPRAPSGTIRFRRCVFAGIPTTGEDFRRPRPPPPKSITSTVLPNTPFPKSKERMLVCWGGT